MAEKKPKKGARKPGGQPGNKNALKHGLYAQRITQAETQVLRSMKVTELEGEIAYMRVVCGRIARILENNGLESEATGTLGEGALRTLSALDRTLITLLSYIRQHALLNGEAPGLDSEIETGKDLARLEHHVFGYLNPPEREDGH